jgi:hypothetical protein
VKEKDKIRGGQWLLSFQQIQDEAGSIIDRICPTRSPSLDDDFRAFKKALEALADGSIHESAAFVEALERLPGILERMKAVPKSDVRKVRMIQDFEVKALNAYIHACESGINWAQERQNRPLEAAMFFRFTQAHKGWKASNKESSAFWVA